MFKRAAVLAVASFALSFPALAGEAGDIAREHLYSGDLAGGVTKLGTLTQNDAEATFAGAFLTLVQSFEGFSQGLYRHGLAAPQTGPMGPMMSVPIPANPNPEKLDYATFRALLEDFSMGLSISVDQFGLAAEKAEEEGGEFKFRLDPVKIRMDINGDGTAAENETIGNILVSAFQMDPSAMAAPRPADTTARGQTTMPSHNTAPNTEIAFDRADASWLSGYSQVIEVQADFLLAHDFSDFFNSSFHRFFPKSGLPMQAFSQGGQLMLDPETDSAIADVIAAIHTINWPVVDRERMKRVYYGLQIITESSRQNWKAILEETDDDRELLPNPRQTAIFPGGEVTDEMVSAWLATLDTADQIIKGELLIPHWRFKQGFDLKAYFQTAERTDFVMILTGYGALPFLKDGPVATAESFAAANRVFGDNLLGYAFWFN